MFSLCNNSRSMARAIGWLVAFICLLYLFAIFDHSSGYNERKPLFDRIIGFWGHGDGTWTHGRFVMPLVLILLWIRRRDFAGMPLIPSNYGIILVGSALFVYWIGYKANMHYFGYVGVHLFLFGLVIWMLGWEWFKKLFFYLGFLAFMWPVIFLDEQLAVPLRYLMVGGASALLNLLGVENLRVGTAIVSQADLSVGLEQGSRFTLDVANPCSGIRSLFALMMVTALYALSMLTGFWKRVILFSFSIPLAVFGNLVRILMLAFGSIWFGTEFAIGTEKSDSAYHMMSGFVVFLVALMGMILIGAILKSGFSGVFGRRVSVVKRQMVGGDRSKEVAP